MPGVQGLDSTDSGFRALLRAVRRRRGIISQVIGL